MLIAKIYEHIRRQTRCKEEGHERRSCDMKVLVTGQSDHSAHEKKCTDEGACKPDECRPGELSARIGRAKCCRIIWIKLAPALRTTMLGEAAKIVFAGQAAHGNIV
jgi:hypothetical protein